VARGRAAAGGFGETRPTDVWFLSVP